MFQLYFNFHLLNINKFEEKYANLILFCSKKTKRIWIKCLALSKIIWYILLFNHLFYQTFWNITILFQNQFVKKSAYDQEISSLKNENSNLKSDVVIILNIKILQIHTYYRQNILNVINFSKQVVINTNIVFPQNKRVLKTAYDSEMQSIKSKMVSTYTYV